ncbi:hypothetical protein BBF96_09405 [Anoxybacter fermentans]|uniref:D-isomer specific 2-hydroxyacid dehydrogenase NAD-binding domain-containing protein n=1 Tax=Anoxybacter fermentans TaxID=1323375 RepID=A0A3S9SZ18_9FIRM|nr:D-2-hydroxyacid dehydrogenase [Anoxybacter fermentans]AZR73586.1 hypothetical protein BBF96_09405 [Anoxybacter fermentans]
MKILIGSKVNSRHIKRLKTIGEELGVELNIVCSEDKAVLKKEVEDAEVLVIWWSTFDPEYVRVGKKLKWIQTLTAGVDSFLLPEVKERGIILTSMKGIHGIPMSEHIMGMLLGVIRGLFKLRENQRQKKWDRPRVEELYGKTLVILGLGNIGIELAKRAKAFGMRVIGVKKTLEKVEFADQVYSSDQWLTAIEEGDVIITILPYTPETYHMIGEDAFARMKNEAIFMNFGRGNVVDEKALIEALKAGQIRAAILDVFEEEPLDPDSPLWEMENVYISPHMSALSNHYMERAFEILARNLQHYIKGESLENVVDFTKGY